MLTDFDEIFIIYVIDTNLQNVFFKFSLNLKRFKWKRFLKKIFYMSLYFKKNIKTDCVQLFYLISYKTNI